MMALQDGSLKISLRTCKMLEILLAPGTTLSSAVRLRHIRIFCNVLTCSRRYADNTIINIDDKKIKKVRVRSGEWVDGFALDYTDGTSTPWPGGNGGVAQEFALADGAC